MINKLKCSCGARLEYIKEAGGYSNSVPDYQGEQYYNEQHMNNTDEIPYIDKNNRDYPLGMRDMNDSSTDYPKPADIEPYVVRLDILYPGPDRPFPPGLPDYQCTIFPFTYPQSDGAEVTNID